MAAALPQSYTVAMPPLPNIFERLLYTSELLLVRMAPFNHMPGCLQPDKMESQGMTGRKEYLVTSQRAAFVVCERKVIFFL